MKSIPLKEHRRAGFTLVEMLVVLAVIGILAALTITAFGPVIRSSKINQGGVKLIDEMNMARQLALSRNAVVEMRFYELGSENRPTEKKYRAFRTFLVPAKDEVEAVGRLQYLPDGVIIADDTTYSTLLDVGNSARSGLVQGQETLKNIPGGTDYIGFTFKPGGGTSLTPVTPPLGNWFLTLCLENDAPDPGTGLPENYFTVQLDPVTGRARGLRP